MRSSENLPSLPPRWRWTTLGEVCQLNPRRPRDLRRKFKADTSVTFVPMAAVSARDAAITAPECRPFSRVVKGYTYMEQGDVIFAKITPCMQNGKHAVLEQTRNGVAFGSTEFHVLRPSTDLTASFLHRFLLRPGFLKEAERNFTGTAGQRRVPPGFLGSTRIALPPVEEQQRIVAALERRLSAVDRAQRAASAMLASLDAMPAALLRDGFRIAEREREWRRWRYVRLGEVCRIVNGSTPPTRDPRCWGGGICWVTPTDLGRLASRVISASARAITTRGYDSCSTTLVPPGSVILSSRAPIGHLAIAGIELCLNQGCKALVPGDGVDGEYLYFVLAASMEELRARGAGATFPEISMKTLKAFRIPLLSLRDQRLVAVALGQRIDAAEACRGVVEWQLGRIRALRNALVRESFRSAEAA